MNARETDRRICSEDITFLQTMSRKAELFHETLS